MNYWLSLPHFNTFFLRAIIAVLVAAVVLVPVWSVSIPPLLDYHNHLARQYILASLPDSPQLQQFYIANWKASPYLAFDGIVQGLAHFLPIDVAAKAFLSLTLLSLALAPVALSWAVFGEVTPIALVGLLFVHNTTVTFGFVNYLFGIGFALCLLAFWIRFREASVWVRISVFPVLATLLFFSHLLGFLVYGLSAGAYEVGRHIALIRNRRPMLPFRVDANLAINLPSLVAQLLLPVAIFLLFGPSSESVSSNTYGDPLRKIVALGGIFSYLMPPYAWRWDTGVLLLLPAGLLLLLVTRVLEIAKPMLWPLAAALGLFFAMPAELFGGWGADHRLLPAIGLMAVGSLRLRSEPWKAAPILLSGTMVVLVAARVAAVTVEWRKADVEYGEFILAFDAIADGSKMYFAFGETLDKQIGRRPYQHMPTLVLMKKRVFVPRLFAASSGWIPLRYKPDVAPLLAIARGGGSQGSLARSNWADVVGAFDYILLVDERQISEPALKQMSLVFKGARVTVYKTAKQ